MLVTATAGEAGLADEESTVRGLGDHRIAELERAAEALGCARVVLLGYRDSGSETPMAPTASAGGPTPFALLDPAGPAEKLAAVLREERADVLTVYDEHGGYGHPDHVQVHHVGVLAAELAGTPVVLEATVDRDLLGKIARVMELFPPLAKLVPPGRFADCYTARSELTHRVDVRGQLAAKRAALAAHHSQAGGGSSIRTVALLLRLPRALLGPVLGREWFRERGRPTGGALLDDLFATLR